MAILPDHRTLPPPPMPVPSRSHGARAWRFVTGAPLDGYARTDATFLRPATRVLTPTGHAGRWSRLPGWKRAAWRVGGSLGTVAEGVGILTHPLLTESLDGLGAASAVTYGGWRAVRAVQEWQHTRTYVRPLHHALCPLLGLSAAMVRPESYLTVPLQFAAEGAEVRVTMPEGFSAGHDVRAAIVRTVTEKLGTAEVNHSWHLVGARPFLTLTPKPKPPRKVMAADVMGIIRAAAESAPLIGLGTSGAPVAVDLDSESPHLLGSIGTGGGKSVLVRGIVSQILHNGGYAIILDVKRVSQSWAKGLPNVLYVRSVADIHDALVMIGEYITERYDLIDQDEDADVGPRIVVVLEELNATMDQLRSYWTKVRGKNDPKLSPAIEAFGQVLYMGRQGKIHAIVMAQMATANAVGGPAFRENFGTRLLGRHSRNNWNMLAPEVPYQKPSRHRGRIQVILAGESRETQTCFWTNEEAREWALSGTVTTSLRGHGSGTDVSMSQVSHTASDLASAASGVSDTGTGGPRLRVVPDPEPDPVDAVPMVTLTEAVRDKVVQITLTNVRKESNRDPEFPPPVGKRGNANLYDPADLMKWERNRVRAGAKVGS